MPMQHPAQVVTPLNVPDALGQFVGMERTAR